MAIEGACITVVNYGIFSQNYLLIGLHKITNVCSNICKYVLLNNIYVCVYCIRLF